MENIKQEIQDFMSEFRSVCMATLNDENQVMCSYAPLIKSKYGFFIYISEISEHFSNIKNNPNNIEIMFLEDESKAKSIILRKRLRYKTNAIFMDKDEKFDEIYDEFEEQNKGNEGIKMIRNMKDFHLIKLEFQDGRFVKGFGGAYDIKNGEVLQAKVTNPHNFSKK